jgi:pyruvate/2-oxoglutarate dehydrogenase complex dihydrolipoamide dehydrogenase (E3) component
VLAGDQVVLNAGTHAAIPDVPGLKAAKPMTHVEALELDRLPEHLLVLGGGFVGLELAQAMRRFGSRVTILERGPQLVARASRWRTRLRCVSAVVFGGRFTSKETRSTLVWGP